MRRALTGVAVVMLLLVAARAAGAYWLLGTTAGARWVAQQLERRGLASAQVVDGRLWGPLRVRDVRYAGAGVTIEADAATLEWSPRELLRRRGHLRHLELARVQLRVAPQPRGAQQAAGALVRLPLDLQVDALAIDELAIVVGARPPWIARQVTLAGAWIGPDVAVDRFAAQLPQAGATSLVGRATLDPSGLRLADVHLAGPLQAELAGYYAYAGDSALTLSWRDAHWPLAGEAVATSAKGSASLRGRLDDYHAAAEAQLHWQDLDATVTAAGKGDRVGATLSTLRAVAAQGTVEGTGALTWEGDPAGELHAQLRDLQPAQWLPQANGHFNGHVDARGTWRASPVLAIDADLHDSTWQGYAFSLRGGAQLADGQWRVAGLELRSGDTVGRLDGAVYPQLDAHASVDSPNLAAVWPGLAGSARATLAAQGSAQQPQLQAALQAKDVAIGGMTVAAIDAHATLDRQRRLQLHVGAQRSHALLAMATATLDVTGTLDANEVKVAMATGPTKALELVAHGRLDLSQRRWSGALDRGRIAPRKLAAWTLTEPARLVLGAEASLEPACWTSGAARACVRVLRETQHQRLAFRLESFSAQYLAPLLPPHTAIDGTLSGTGQIDWGEHGLADLKLDLASSAVDWRQDQRHLLHFEPGKLEVKQTGAGVRAALALPMQGGGIRAQAQLGAAEVFGQRAVGGEIDVQLQDLALLGLLTPEITDVGPAGGHGHFVVDGTVAAPRARGELVLHADRLHLASPNLDLTGVVVTVHGSEDGRLAIDAAAHSGDGHFVARGEVDPRADPLGLDIAIQGDAVQVVDTPDARVWASPDLRVQRQQQVLLVTGTVLVPHAEITPKRFEKGVSVSPDQVLVREGARQAQGLLELRTLVTLKLGDAVSFQGKGLSTRLTGAIEIADISGDAARGRGQIQLEGGHYKAYGQDLTITTGRLIFDGSVVTDPALELRAERKPREDVTVGVQVRGRLERPEFILFSTPPMTQEEQLAWLVLGRPLQDTGGGQDRALLANAALSLGLTGGDFLAQKLRGHLGIDEINIGAQPGETADQAQLTLGKYLSPRLYVSYGVGLFQPGHTLRLRYDVGHGFKLQTETGVESGGDVLYSIDR